MLWNGLRRRFFPTEGCFFNTSLCTFLHVIKLSFTCLAMVYIPLLSINSLGRVTQGMWVPSDFLYVTWVNSFLRISFESISFPSGRSHFPSEVLEAPTLANCSSSQGLKTRVMEGGGWMGVRWEIRGLWPEDHLLSNSICQSVSLCLQRIALLLSRYVFCCYSLG